MMLIDNSEKVLELLFGLAITGWNLYLSAVKRRLDEKLSEERAILDRLLAADDKWKNSYFHDWKTAHECEANKRWERVLAEFITKEQMGEIERRILQAIAGLEDRINRLWEKK